MPMADAMELFDYWNVFPPVHILMRAQVRYEPPEKTDAARTPRSLSNRVSAPKLATAPKRDREIFEALKKAHAG